MLTLPIALEMPQWVPDTVPCFILSLNSIRRSLRCVKENICWAGQTGKEDFIQDNAMRVQITQLHCSIRQRVLEPGVSYWNGTREY